MTLSIQNSLQMVQSNGYWTSFEDLRILEGGVLAGGAFTMTDGGKRMFNGWIVDGRVTDSSLEVTIQWENGPRGHYSGQLDATRRLVGVTYDVRNPTSQATWTSRETF